MPAIEIKNLKKYFGKVKAVDGISLVVEKGEIFGFLGPNGAGKTTTIRCMMDFIRPTGGKIRIFGKDARQDSVELKKNIGYLSSDIYLYDKWTGQEHIDFAVSLKGPSPRLGSLIKRLDFNPKAKVKTLSTGNKQKLNIILSFLGTPDILILDEPTRGLDPLLQNEIYAILQEFQKEGKTIFLSSHNLPEVERICGRVGIIRQGKIVAVERIEDLKNKSMHSGRVSFEGVFAKNDFLKEGFTITGQNHNGFTFTIRGEINPFLNTLAKYRVKDFEIAHANLEDIFLTFYKQ